MSNHIQTQLNRSVGLIGAIAMVVGSVIGMGIYALIAKVGMAVGAAIWMPFILAMFAVVFSVLPFIQISAALPRAGATYVYTSRLLHPMVGTIVSCMMIFSITCSMAFLSIGLAGYIQPYMPFSLSISALSTACPALFLILYLFFSFRLATVLQVLLTILLIAALFIYGFFGISNIDITMTTSLPNGIGGLVKASILCYTAWFGLSILVEIGEEIKHAKRNIPLAIAIGSFIILVSYIIISVVFVNSVSLDSEKMGEMTAPLIDTGKLFLPPVFVALLAAGAGAAALSTFNAAAIAVPREMLAQARDGIMPHALSQISPKTQAPNNAIITTFTLLFILLGAGKLFNWPIDFYANLTAQGLLLISIFIALAVLRLPKKFPEYYAKAYFKIPKQIMWIVVFLAFLCCGGLFVLVLFELPITGVFITAIILLAGAFHQIRVRSLTAKGVNWQERINNIPGYDEELKS